MMVQMSVVELCTMELGFTVQKRHDENDDENRAFEGMPSTITAAIIQWLAPQTSRV
jgi:hypothetical protein